MFLLKHVMTVGALLVACSTAPFSETPQAEKSPQTSPKQGVKSKKGSKQGSPDSNDLGTPGASGLGLTKVTYAQVKPILDRSCVAGCHGPDGSRPSDLSTYSKAITYKSATVRMSTGRTPSMPRSPGVPLSAEEKDLLLRWEKDGFLEKDSSGTAAPLATPAKPAAPPVADGTTVASDGQTVTFRIKAGTGRGPWNSAENPVRVKRGQTLIIQNDDSSPHQLHTNGSPCPHGFRIQSGAQAQCRINGTRANGLYDHLTGGQFYMTVEQ